MRLAQTVCTGLAVVLLSASIATAQSGQPARQPDVSYVATTNKRHDPEAALGEFRRWLRDIYIGEGKFRKYITGQADKRELPISFAQLAIAAYEGED